MIFRGLLQKDKIFRFWQSITDMIAERMSRKALKKRPFVNEDEVNYYANLEEP